MSYNCRCNRPASGLLKNSLPRGCVAGFLILLHAGCMQPDLVQSESRFVAAATETTAGRYLDMLYQFGNADAQERAALYERASTAAVLDPSPPNRLQLALLKAWPGHPGYNPEAAQRMLETALLQRHGLTTEMETLARVYLLIVEQQIQAMNRNSLLSSELEEALDKLEALTTIERTVETVPRAEAVPESAP